MSALGAEATRTPRHHALRRAPARSRAIEGLQAGADDYLVKPFSARELVARVTVAREARALSEGVRADRERLLENERAARAEAEAANRAKDEFLAMLGHELRNPLAPIVTALRLARERDAVVPARSGRSSSGRWRTSAPRGRSPRRRADRARGRST